jgi:hypothetical protein
MLHYWLTVFIKTFWDSWAFTDRTPAGMAYWFIVLAITIGALIKKHGWRDALKNFWRTSGEGLLIGGVAYALVLFGHFLYEPFHLQEDELARHADVITQRDLANNHFGECSSNLTTERVKTGLLERQITTIATQVSGQQTFISSQQLNATKAQSTFDLCVATLAKASAPVAKNHQMIGIGDETPSATAKHTMRALLLTNVPTTPVQVVIMCDNAIKNASIYPLGNVPHSALASPVRSGTVFMPITQWQFNMPFPTWSPEQPLVVKLEYDEDSLGSCQLRS